MKYALLVYSDQARWAEMSEEEAARAREESMPAWVACFQAIEQVDPKSEGYELDAAAEAKTVRVRGGEIIVTDGPFAETKEQLGGVFLIDCPDLDVAIDLASKVPAAQYGSMEVRPTVEH